MGRDPSLRILAVSYAEGLSNKLALDCMKVMEAGWYKDAFPRTRIAKGRGARSDFEITRCGGRFSTSVGGTLTGRGGDIILLDDPHKPEDAASEVKRKSVLDWYGSTLLSRLNDPKAGPIVLIQQRVHEGDLAGTLLEQGGWEHLDLPAISEDRVAIDLRWFFRQQVVVAGIGFHNFENIDAYASDFRKAGTGTSFERKTCAEENGCDLSLPAEI